METTHISFTWWMKKQIILQHYNEILSITEMNKLLVDALTWRNVAIDCVPPSKFICWNPNAQCDGIKRWGLLGMIGHEGGTLMKELWTRIKENPPVNRTTLPFLPWEVTVKRWSSMKQKICPHQTTTKSAIALILDFPASREINLCCLCHPVYAIFLE